MTLIKVTAKISALYKNKDNFFLGFFFSELGTEPRALHFPGKRSTTELNPQPQNKDNF